MNLYKLPTSLSVGGVFWDIRTDYRVILGIFRYLTDRDYSDYERLIITLKCLYVDFEKIPEQGYIEAYQQANIFFAGGREDDSEGTKKPAIMDWEQDAPLIIPAVNAVAGKEVRALDYLHWWTFLGYYMEIGEGTFSTVLSIRKKNQKGEKLEKWEMDYCREHPDIVYLRKKTEDEKRMREEDRQALKELLKL